MLCSDTLRVPLIGRLAGSCRAASSTRPTVTAALAVHRRAAGVGVAGVAAGAAAAPDSGARKGKGLDAVVDAHGSVRVRGLVGARELDQRAGAARAAVLDLDLHAGHVVFGLVDVGSVNA